MPAPTSRFVLSVSLLIISVLASIALYQLQSFDPAPLPPHALAVPPLKAPFLNDRMLSGAEFVGVGRLDKPEDIAYHPESGLIYTGCADGWVKRVKVNKSAAADSVVEDWVNTGGRPLGIAFAGDGDVIVADADKGLLSINKEGSRVKVITDGAEGVKFKLTDAVDIAEDDVMYFPDASHKYGLKDYVFDILEGKPHGRLLSYDPSTKTTRVLVRDLYFANGVVVSPRQDHIVFCETPLRRCSKYYIRGEKRGNIEAFVEGLPGFPDNIRYDGRGHYWVALISVRLLLLLSIDLSSFFFFFFVEPLRGDGFEMRGQGLTTPWDLSLKYPFLRKMIAITAKYGFDLNFEKNAGVVQLDVDGKPVAHYRDPSISRITSGVKIGNHLYCGSILYSHITCLNLHEFPATSAA